MAKDLLANPAAHAMVEIADLTAMPIAGQYKMFNSFPWLKFPDVKIFTS